MSGRRRAEDPPLHGVLLVDKPAGPTSHDVVGWIRWVLGVRRVGHAGTLDPLATGLLVIGVGAATKLAPYLTGQDKRYRARFVLGASTTTADVEGSVVEALACPPGLETRIPAALAALAEVRALPPPVFSAIHVEGRRAHELAREGQALVLEERPMEVRALVPGPVRRRGDRVEVEVELLVSKGTYVRALAEAFGRLLGVPAHLGALHRTDSGALGLDHPQALTGLLAEQVRLEPRAAADDPGPLRWRLRLPSCDTHEAVAAELRSRLLPAWEVVPMPVLHASAEASGRRAMARLAAGQTLVLPDPGLSAGPPIIPTTPAEARPERVAIASRDDGAVVVARLDVDPTGIRLRPERVVVPPAGDP